MPKLPDSIAAIDQMLTSTFRSLIDKMGRGSDRKNAEAFWAARGAMVWSCLTVS